MPIKDEDNIEFIWIVEYLQPNYKGKIGDLISHFLGHEGENSLGSFLIDEGLANEITSDNNDFMN